jgi:hypothetical protein
LVSAFANGQQFFPISTMIDVSTGISSFAVTIDMVDGTTESFDNNGNLYPMTDAIILQQPQSCLSQASGALTVTAAVSLLKPSAGATTILTL